MRSTDLQVSEITCAYDSAKSGGFVIVAVTGHRPDKLGGYSDIATSRLKQFALETLAKYQPSEVITGMALGWDQAIAGAAYALGIPFLAFVPFIGQEGKWPKESQLEYRRLLELAELVYVVSSGGYSSDKMHTRNRAMVDHCDSLIALWNGSVGGTSNCHGYAVVHGRNVINVWPEWQEFCAQW